MIGPALELRGVTKRYAGHTAVRNLSLSVPRGAIYGLLGPNGAGKTTTIRMAMGIVRPDEGTITVLGHAGGAWGISHRVGYLPEERGLYRKMKVFDLLVFLAEAKGIRRNAAREQTLAWLDRLGLGGWQGRKVDELSKGMQQKVQFIATLLHQPEIVIFDEPFAGLDPVNSQVLKDAVRDLARSGVTIVFSTHVMEQAERLCDAVCIIAKGEKVLDGAVSEVKRAHRGRHVTVEVAEGVASIDSVLADRTVVARADSYGHYAEVELADGGDPQQLLVRLVRAGARVTRFEVTEPSLHKIFIDKVGPEAAVAPANGRE